VVLPLVVEDPVVVPLVVVLETAVEETPPEVEPWPGPMPMPMYPAPPSLGEPNSMIRPQPA
jgi:hypothetical protein